MSSKKIPNMAGLRAAPGWAASTVIWTGGAESWAGRVAGWARGRRAKGRRARERAAERIEVVMRVATHVKGWECGSLLGMGAS
jgi:hypothetical protein